MTDVLAGVRIVHLPDTSLRYALREPMCRGFGEIIRGDVCAKFEVVSK